MELKRIGFDFSVCKVSDFSVIDRNMPFCFTGKTDEECSLVCPTDSVPVNTVARDDGWRAFRIQGTLDFSLVGILSKISSLLAQNQIGVFAISTYNTDYVLTKQENFDRALAILSEAGYHII